MLLLLSGCATNSALTLIKASQRNEPIIPSSVLIEQELKKRSFCVGKVYLDPEASLDTPEGIPQELFCILIWQQVKRGFTNAKLDKGNLPAYPVDIAIEQMKFTRGMFLIPDPSILRVRMEVRNLEDDILMKGALGSLYMPTTSFMLYGFAGVLPTGFEGQQWTALAKMIPAIAVAITKVTQGLQLGKGLKEIEIYPEALAAGGLINPDMFLRGKPFGLSELKAEGVYLGNLHALKATKTAVNESMSTITSADSPQIIQQKVERPILHIDVVGKGKDRKLVTVATYPNGQHAGTFQAYCAAWSPDGTWFSCFTGSSLKVMNLKGENRTIFTTRERLKGCQPAWSPDGEHIAFLSWDSGRNEFFLNVIDVAHSKPKAHYRLPRGTLSPYFTAPLYKFRWSPDGRKILIAWENVIVVDLRNGKVQTISEKQAAAEWTPAGDAVYYLPFLDAYTVNRKWEGLFKRKLDAKRPITLADATRLSALGLNMPKGMNFGLLAISPSGQMLAIAARSSKTTSTLRIFKTHPEVDLDQPLAAFDTDLVTALDWATDEKNIATISYPLQDGRFEVVVRVVRLDNAEQSNVARLNLTAARVDIDLLGLIKTLSWSQ
jgi:WD40 repeat protein